MRLLCWFLLNQHEFGRALASFSLIIVQLPRLWEWCLCFSLTSSQGHGPIRIKWPGAFRVIIAVILLQLHTYGYCFFLAIFRCLATIVQRCGCTHMHSRCVGLVLCLYCWFTGSIACSPWRFPPGLYSGLYIVLGIHRYIHGIHVSYSRLGDALKMLLRLGPDAFWQNLTWHMPFGIYQSVLRTGPCCATNGVVNSLSIRVLHLVAAVCL